jgi:dihydrofolate synthase / folylpolyglutamate synthase
VGAKGTNADGRTSDLLLAHLKTLHPMLIDLSLDRIVSLLAKLGDPHLKLPPVIHIAGTNGKGSTTAFLKAMLEAAGRRVHLYTSPHLVRFHERIQVAGDDGISRPVTEEHLVDLLSRVEHANAGSAMTFFEMTTAAALLAFSEIPADAIILEVGLGGRADATNVIDAPRLTIITPVAMDHADKLGDTVGKIAFEKAGILKRHVPCVVSMQSEEGLTVIQAEAGRLGAPLTIWGQEFEAFEQRGRMVFQNADTLLDLPRPGLVGRHQIVNAGTAIAAALLLDDLGLGANTRAIERGLTTVVWPARMQRLTGGRLTTGLSSDAEVWLDGGHNPAGGQALAQTAADLEERSSKPLYLIVGMMGQKDAIGFLRPFQGQATELITVPIPGAHEAPFAADALADVARTLGFKAFAAADLGSALHRADRANTGLKRILICGSLYLAGHVLALETGATQQSN